MSGSAVDLGVAIAAAMRAERSRRHWTQEELGRRVGWSRSTVQAIESGQRQVLAADLPGLCRAFDLPLSRFLLEAAPEEVGPLRLGE